MKNFIVVDGDYEGKTQTEYDYEVGEILTYNSDSRIKCVGVERYENEINYMFVEGRKVFIFE